jgi:hypothetical protein
MSIISEVRTPHNLYNNDHAHHSIYPNSLKPRNIKSATQLKNQKNAYKLAKQ